MENAVDVSVNATAKQTKAYQNDAPVGDCTSVALNVYMKAADSQPDAKMSKTASQSQLDVKMSELLAAASNEAMYDTI